MVGPASHHRAESCTLILLSVVVKARAGALVEASWWGLIKSGPERGAPCAAQRNQTG